jgi:hypothetical protein
VLSLPPCTPGEAIRPALREPASRGYERTVAKGSVQGDERKAVPWAAFDRIWGFLPPGNIRAHGSPANLPGEKGSRREATTEEEVPEGRKQVIPTAVHTLVDRCSHPQHIYRYMNFVRETKFSDPWVRLERICSSAQTDQTMRSHIHRIRNYSPHTTYFVTQRLRSSRNMHRRRYNTRSQYPPEDTTCFGAPLLHISYAAFKKVERKQGAACSPWLMAMTSLFIRMSLVALVMFVMSHPIRSGLCTRSDRRVDSKSSREQARGARVAPAVHQGSQVCAQRGFQSRRPGPFYSNFKPSGRLIVLGSNQRVSTTPSNRVAPQGTRNRRETDRCRVAIYQSQSGSDASIAYLHQRPQAEMSAVLGGRHAAIAHLEHVRIWKQRKPCVRNQPCRSVHIHTASAKNELSKAHSLHKP